MLITHMLIQMLPLPSSHAPVHDVCGSTPLGIGLDQLSAVWGCILQRWLLRTQTVRQHPQRHCSLVHYDCLGPSELPSILAIRFFRWREWLVIYNPSFVQDSHAIRAQDSDAFRGDG